MKVVDLTALDLATASGLVIVAGVIGLLLRLGMTRTLVVAAVRTVVQLIAVGYVLKWIFRLDNAPAVGAICGLMLVAAGHAAVGRSERGYRGVLWRATATLVITGVLTTLAVTQVIVGIEPWYAPQYIIPLMGMILGNTLTGLSLSLDALLVRLEDRRDRIEAALCLGASRQEAVGEVVAESIRRGMIPILNAMTVVGLVSLPGMMTGQILGGVEPMVAVKWQIIVMFMLAASNALATTLLVMWTVRRLFEGDRRLRTESIIVRKS